MKAPTFDIIQAPLDDIYVVGERRPADDEAVHRLAQSIENIGLRTPITVREAEVTDPEDGEVLMAFALIAGRHRLEAYRSLGLTHIPAIVRECSAAEAELWEIDENLCRAELSPADRAQAMARRKVIYEQLHPETKDKIAGALGSNRAQGNATAKLATASFAEATASATGSSERAVRRDAERGEKVIDEVLGMIRGTKLDTGAYLDRLKKLPPNEQVQAVKRDLAIDRKKEREERQAEHDRQRDETLASLPENIRQAEAAKEANRQKGKETVGIDPATASEILRDFTQEDRVAELEEAVRVLEARNAELEAENRLFGDMKVQWEQGDFKKVIADRDEQIRVLREQFHNENAEKVREQKRAKWAVKELRKLGYSSDILIDAKTGEVRHG